MSINGKKVVGIGGSLLDIELRIFPNARRKDIESVESKGMIPLLMPESLSKKTYIELAKIVDEIFIPDEVREIDLLKDEELNKRIEYLKILDNIECGKGMIEIKKPIIGISGQYLLEKDVIGEDLLKKDLGEFDNGYAVVPLSYAEAIEINDGIPLLLPDGLSKESVKHLMTVVDGLILTGGKDVDPSSYNEEKLDVCGITDPRRDIHDKNIISIAIEKDIPILGICRGSQMLNAALGGTLYQDIVTQYPNVLHHVQWSTVESQKSKVHEVNLLPQSRLSKIIGSDRVGVNSGHHQASKKLCDNGIIAALSDDGMIEAYEVTNQKFCFGIQWHPEQIIRFPEHNRIFEEFLKASKSS